MQGTDALNRAVFDAAAETLSSRLPFPLPVPSQFVEEEDLANLNNLRRLSSLLSGSSESSYPTTEVSRFRRDDVVELDMRIRSEPGWRFWVSWSTQDESQESSRGFSSVKRHLHQIFIFELFEVYLVFRSSGAELFQKPYTALLQAYERGMASVQAELTIILQALSSSAKYLPLLSIIPEVFVSHSSVRKNWMAALTLFHRYAHVWCSVARIHLKEICNRRVDMILVWIWRGEGWAFSLY